MMVPWSLQSLVPLVRPLREWKRNGGEERVESPPTEFVEWCKQPQNLIQLGIYLMRPISYVEHSHASHPTWDGARELWLLIYAMLCADDVESFNDLLLLLLREGVLDLVCCEQCADEGFGEYARKIVAH